ncbi:MAG: fructosamine kinase family protein, partial [Woeseiaceae bacterium]|nr:fructosamine kinase family protein [Woeseiaceae bacterium]
MRDWQNIFAALRQDAISVAENASPRSVGGGDISAAWRIDTDDAAVFVKTGPGNSLDMFEAEAEGLRELLAAKAVRVPEVLGCG